MIEDFEGALFLDSDVNDDRADNRPARFHTFMHTQFSFGDGFEVGLLELQLPYTWENIISDQYVGAFIGTENCGLMTLKSGCYYAIDTLIGRINDMFDREPNPPKLMLDSGTIVCVEGNFLGNKNVQIRLARDLAAILGLNSWFDIQTVNLPDGGGSVNEVQPQGPWSILPLIRAERPVNLHAAIERLYISCSIVKHRAHDQHELLRIVPVCRNSAFGEILVIKYDKPIFVPIAHSTFDRIEICIRDKEGREPLFTAGNVIVALEIRRKRDA